jgi:alcohol dehydrogenase class IV
MNRIYLPVDIYFGENAIAQSGDNIFNLGHKPMIVTGRQSAKVCGAEEDITKLLERLDREFVIYNEVTENPEIETINQGIKYFIESQCDYVIGIGGGSPLDAAKAIALGAANHIEGDQLFDTKLHEKCYPIVAIPTTSGTGSEVTQYSVLTDTKANKKAGFTSPLIFPIVAFVDPKYTISLSQKVTRDTAIDALSHLLEGLYSNRRNPLIFPMIYDGVKLIVHNLKDLLLHPSDIKLREKIMKASLYGGIVIAHSGTTLQHSIGYPLTTEFGLSHGLANGVVMKYIMELYYPAIKDELDELFLHLGMSKEDFYKWLDSLDFSFDMKIHDDFIENKILEVVQSRNMANNPFTVSTTQIKNIYYQFK